jgi:hypothetical protein
MPSLDEMDLWQDGNDIYGDYIDPEKLYECPDCHHVCTVIEMIVLPDCNDQWDAVYSNYGCPKCWFWCLRITDWKEAS